MYKENKEALSGNDQFEGYNVDLVEHISKILNFDYEIRIVADGNYGSTDKDTGQWNGMIGELLTQVGLHASFIWLHQVMLNFEHRNFV